MISRSSITGQISPLPVRAAGTRIQAEVIEIMGRAKTVAIVFRNRDDHNEAFLVFYRPDQAPLVEIGQVGTLTFIKGSVGLYWQWQATPPESLAQADSIAVPETPLP